MAGNTEEEAPNKLLQEIIIELLQINVTEKKKKNIIGRTIPMN